MFSTSLRSRPDVSSLVLILSSPSSGLREIPLQTHDLSLPIPLPLPSSGPQPTTHPHSTHTTPQQTLHILLLTPISLTPSLRDTTLQRIDRLSTLTPSRVHTAVIFILSPPLPTPVHTTNKQQKNKEEEGNEDVKMGGMAAYAELQVLMHEMVNPPILLPVPEGEKVVEMVRGYARGVGQGVGGVMDAGGKDGNVDVRRDLLAHVTCTYVFPLLPPSTRPPFSLFPFFTPSPSTPHFPTEYPAPNFNNNLQKPQRHEQEEKLKKLTLPPHSAPTRPLPEHTTFLLGDIVSSLSDLATMATTEAGRRVLGRYLEAREVREIGEFWDEEWVVE